MSDKRNYVVFWTYGANCADRVFCVNAESPVMAILHSCGLIFMSKPFVRYLVTDVSDHAERRVFNGTILQALQQYGWPGDRLWVEYHRGELLKCGYTEEELPPSPHDFVCVECGESFDDCRGHYPAKTGHICTDCVNATV